VSASMSVCVVPAISLSPPPAIQIGATLRFPLTMQITVAATLRVASSHPHLVAYVVSSVKEGVVLVLEAVGTGSYSFTLTFEGQHAQSLCSLLFMCCRIHSHYQILFVTPHTLARLI
jgi:hypothetical protein